MSYAQYDEDPWEDLEAIEVARMDADLELAEMNATADALHAAEARGICPHWSLQALTCVKCRRVFRDDEDYWAAVDEVVNGL